MTKALRDIGSQLGISLISMLPQTGTPSEIERVFAAMAQQRPRQPQPTSNLPKTAAC